MSRRKITLIAQTRIHGKNLSHISCAVQDSSIIVAILCSSGTFVASSASEIRRMNFILGVLVQVSIPGNRLTCVPASFPLLIDPAFTLCFAGRNVSVINSDHGRSSFLNFLWGLWRWRVAQRISYPESALLFELQSPGGSGGIRTPGPF